MTSEDLSNIIAESINSVDLDKLKNDKSEAAKDFLLAILKLCGKDYIGAAESAIQTYKDVVDYRESEFFRKYYKYLYELSDTTAEQRHRFSEEVQEKAEDFSGNVILGIVDRMDNIHKEKALAKLTIARINGWITIEEFFRLSSMLERIPYVDLKMLPYYKEPFYDESGDTELLFATGSLNQHTIDANAPSKYVLSTLGEKLLCFGLGIKVEMERELGTNIEVDTLSNEEIEEIFNEKMNEAEKKQLSIRYDKEKRMIELGEGLK